MIRFAPRSKVTSAGSPRRSSARDRRRARLRPAAATVATTCASTRGTGALDRRSRSAAQQELPRRRVAVATRHPGGCRDAAVADRERPAEVVRPEQRVRRPRRTEPRIATMPCASRRSSSQLDEVDERIAGRDDGAPRTRSRARARRPTRRRSPTSEDPPRRVRALVAAGEVRVVADHRHATRASLAVETVDAGRCRRRSASVCCHDWRSTDRTVRSRSRVASRCHATTTTPSGVVGLLRQHSLLLETRRAGVVASAPLFVGGVRGGFIRARAHSWRSTSAYDLADAGGVDGEPGQASLLGAVGEEAARGRAAPAPAGGRTSRVGAVPRDRAVRVVRIDELRNRSGVGGQRADRRNIRRRVGVAATLARNASASARSRADPGEQCLLERDRQRATSATSSIAAGRRRDDGSSPDGPTRRRRTASPTPRPSSRTRAAT